MTLYTKVYQHVINACCTFIYVTEVVDSQRQIEAINHVIIRGINLHCRINESPIWHCNSFDVKLAYHREQHITYSVLRSHNRSDILVLSVKKKF